MNAFSHKSDSVSDSSYNMYIWKHVCDSDGRCLFWVSLSVKTNMTHMSLRFRGARRALCRGRCHRQVSLFLLLDFSVLFILLFWSVLSTKLVSFQRAMITCLQKKPGSELRLENETRFVTGAYMHPLTDVRGGGGWYISPSHCELIFLYVKLDCSYMSN